jgi:2-haloalkanoic acid dehalogenase type II
MNDLTARVASGAAPWRSSEALRRAALLAAAESAGLGELPAAALDSLATAGRRLRPWPDSARALRALARSFAVVALSNASLAELTGMSADGGLAWHCVLSAELVRAYKPDPAVYRMALDFLGLATRQTMMVAAPLGPARRRRARHELRLRGPARRGRAGRRRSFRHLRRGRGRTGRAPSARSRRLRPALACR